MHWGVLDSFRAYLTGPVADGGWQTRGGAVFSEGDFVFTGDRGTVDTVDGTAAAASLGTDGAVNFTGHNGVLDTTFADPEISVGTTSGSLSAKVVSNDTDGEPRDFGRIELATLSVQSLAVEDGVLEVAAEVTLTDDGATAMGDFYDGGATMDPVTFRAAVGDGCDAAAADLADPMPQDEGDGTGAAEGDGGVTIHDSHADAGTDTDRNAVITFLTTPATAVPSALALLAVLAALWFGIRRWRA